MTKNTRQKEAILKVLRGTRSHPTADWIYHEVRKEMPNISLGTVYRNLKLLSAQHEILEVELSGTLSRYDACTDAHYHFRCEQCGSVFDVEGLVDRKLNRKVAQKTGFLVSHHCLEFHGLCTACQ